MSRTWVTPLSLRYNNTFRELNVGAGGLAPGRVNFVSAFGGELEAAMAGREDRIHTRGHGLYFLDFSAGRPAAGGDVVEPVAGGTLTDGLGVDFSLLQGIKVLLVGEDKGLGAAAVDDFGAGAVFADVGRDQPFDATAHEL